MNSFKWKKTRLLNFDEEVYFEIIRQKTAALISACCRSGAQSTKSSEEHIRLMTEFGEKVGMAFQIKDDLFDYGAGKDIGKPTGIDIQERKTTLPLIYALNRASNSDRKRIVNIVKNHNTNAIKVKEVIQFVSASGGIEYATQKMHDYARQSLELLSQLPETEARKSLETLVNYTIERER